MPIDDVGGPMSSDRSPEGGQQLASILDRGIFDVEVSQVSLPSSSNAQLVPLPSASDLQLAPVPSPSPSMAIAPAAAGPALALQIMEEMEGLAASLERGLRLK